MSLKSFSVVIITAFFLTACASRYNMELTTPKQLKINQKLSISVKEKDSKPIDSIWYYLDGKRLASNKNIDISKLKLGKHAVSATVFYGTKQKQLTNTIYFLSDRVHDSYSYEIINEYPHDPKAFTQGLEYYNGFLYESTGQNGESSLRKVELKTGKVLKKFDFEDKYFGEGMTIFGNELFVLTWQSKKGFIFDLETFEKKGEFFYGSSEQGWGLTHNADELIKSDGTERIWFLNPKNQKEQSYIEVYSNKGKISKINELELINGQIYANRWQSEKIIMINPKNGALKGIINLEGLQAKAGQKGDDNVLNGIAYDKENDRLFVTGKRWNKLFEIKLIKK